MSCKWWQLPPRTFSRRRYGRGDRRKDFQKSRWVIFNQILLMTENVSKA
jgi:hypothetical protein